jgi:hypothetical protein
MDPDELEELLDQEPTPRRLKDPMVQQTRMDIASNARRPLRRPPPVKGLKDDAAS